MGLLMPRARVARAVALGLASMGVTACNLVLGIEQLDGGSAADAVADATMHRHDSFVAPPDTFVAPADAGCAVVAVTVDPSYFIAKIENGVFAVQGGTANTSIAATPGYESELTKRKWFALLPYKGEGRVGIDPEAGVSVGVSACLPAGEHYTLQYWQISSTSVDSGAPPQNTQQWQIGLSSASILVTLDDAGKGVPVKLELTATDAPEAGANVPSIGSFFGAWATWTYGPCGGDAGACPDIPGTNLMCDLGVCVDTNYDVRNCGGLGQGCSGLTCCAGKCVSAAQSPNCGTCDNTCAGGSCMACQTGGGTGACCSGGM